MTRKKSTARHAELKALLDAKRQELRQQIAASLKHTRTESDRRPGSDDGDVPNNGHEDIELALTQMKADLLARVDVAYRKLEQGTYGNCVQCEKGISPERLQALPFALRCRECEERREGDARTASGPPRMTSLFASFE